MLSPFIPLWLLVVIPLGGPGDAYFPKSGQYFGTEAECRAAIPIVSHLLRDDGKRHAFRCTLFEVEKY